MGFVAREPGESLMEFSEDEFQFGPFANVLYLLGRLDPSGELSQRDVIQTSVFLE